MDEASSYYEALEKCAARYEAMAATELDVLAFVLEFADGVTNRTLPLMKLNRWLGYIQGVLIERGHTTVAAERDWTRPLFRPLDFA